MVNVSTVLNILTCLISLVGVVPLFVYLDKLPQIAFPAALLAAFFMEKKALRPLQGMIPTVLSIILFLFYAVRISRENILDPAINIVVILLAVRLLSERIPRNYLQIFALSLFALSASSLYSLSPIFLVYLLALILCIASSLVLLTFYTVDSRLALSRKAMKRLVTHAVAMPAAAMPLILVLFAIMPRPQFPLWDFLAPSAEKVTGLSEQIEPGSSSQVRPVKTAVLRAQSPLLARTDLYWRGIVLNTPRNNAWVRSAITEGGYVRFDQGEQVRQTIFPEPNSSQYLITLDTPAKISGIRAVQSSDVVFTRRKTAGRVRYDSVSILKGTIRVRGDIDQQFYLKLPDQVSPRVKALGKRIAAQGKTDRERLAALEEYFSSARFRYMTTNLPHGDAIANFLFTGKAGHCELFASSFMTLLRVAGVPSRLVGGYYGGDYNEMGGYYLVTEDMAHVWVEVFLGKDGWVRKDPSVFAVDFTGVRAGEADDFVARVRKITDSLSYFWNLTVISYDLEKQLHLFRSANTTMRKISFPAGNKSLFAALLGLCLLIAAGWFAKRTWVKSPEERVLRRFFRRVAKHYPSVSVSPSTGLMEIAKQTDDPVVREFAELYCGSAYRDRRPSASELIRLRLLVRAMANSSRKDAKGLGTRHKSLT
jgi:transglutaminase-like putative cysteine protease